VLLPPSSELVPAIKGVAVFEHRLDVEHTEEAFAFSASIVHRDVERGCRGGKIAKCVKESALRK
jgi:hypothetical protein